METKKLTLLLVEDEVSILETMYTILSTFFKEVITATNGEEGLEIYTQNKNEIDLVVTDITMPIMNGIDMIKNIKELNNELPIYVLSGDLKYEKLTYELGVKHFFSKPIYIPRLFEKIYEDLKV